MKYVVLWDAGYDISTVYGIFNSIDEAQSFIDGRVLEYPWIEKIDYAIVRIIPATAAGIL